MLDDNKGSDREDIMDSILYFKKARQLPEELQPGTRNFEILCRARFDQNAELKCVYHHAVILYCIDMLKKGASFESVVPVLSLFYGEEWDNYIKSQSEDEYADDSYSIDEMINDIESTIRDFQANAEQNSVK